jgi:hypothetical protein
MESRVSVPKPSTSSQNALTLNLSPPRAPREPRALRLPPRAYLGSTIHSGLPFPSRKSHGCCSLLSPVCGFVPIRETFLWQPTSTTISLPFPEGSICAAGVWQGLWITLTCLATSSLFQPLKGGWIFPLVFKILSGASWLWKGQLWNRLHWALAWRTHSHCLLLSQSKKMSIGLRVGFQGAHPGLTPGGFQPLENLRLSSPSALRRSSNQKALFIHPLCWVFQICAPTSIFI